MPLTDEPMEQREQSDACIDSAESRQRKTEGQVLGTNADGTKNEDVFPASKALAQGANNY